MAPTGPSADGWPPRHPLLHLPQKLLGSQGVPGGSQGVLRRLQPQPFFKCAVNHQGCRRPTGASCLSAKDPSASPHLPSFQLRLSQ